MDNTENEREGVSRCELDAPALLDVEDFLCDRAGMDDIRMEYCLA